MTIELNKANVTIGISWDPDMETGTITLVNNKTMKMTTIMLSEDQYKDLNEVIQGK